jgi:hypothetical protein
MQQRQPRLGDILDDYCPRERRVTNHAVVAMVGDAVKQTRCTTCDAEHEFKQAKVPRLRRKDEPAGAGAAPLPRRVVHDPLPTPDADVDRAADAVPPVGVSSGVLNDDPPLDADDTGGDEERPELPEEGPVHRRLIRAQLPKIDGQPPVARQAPDFTIRQPAAGRPGRFRGRPPQPQPQQHQQRGGPMFGNRSNGNAVRDPRGGERAAGGRPPMGARANKHHGSGRKRSK